MCSDSVVRARIDRETKERAKAALEAMGLSVSDAIRLLMLSIAEEGRFPFSVPIPNATTDAAMSELERGEGKRSESADELFRDLGL